MFDYCSFTHQFMLNYEETRNVAIGHAVSSGDISAGGHLWRVKCYPRGDKEETKLGRVPVHLPPSSERIQRRHSYL